MTIIRWEPPLYEPNQRIADVNGGRYSVRRAYKGAHRRWIALLNGKRISPDIFPTREACMKYVEEVHQPNLERDPSAAHHCRTLSDRAASARDFDASARKLLENLIHYPRLPADMP